MGEQCLASVPCVHERFGREGYTERSVSGDAWTICRSTSAKLAGMWFCSRLVTFENEIKIKIVYTIFTKNNKARPSPASYKRLILLDGQRQPAVAWT